MAADHPRLSGVGAWTAPHGVATMDERDTHWAKRAPGNPDPGNPGNPPDYPPDTPEAPPDGPGGPEVPPVEPPEVPPPRG